MDAPSPGRSFDPLQLAPVLAALAFAGCFDPFDAPDPGDGRDTGHPGSRSGPGTTARRTAGQPGSRITSDNRVPVPEIPGQYLYAPLIRVSAINGPVTVNRTRCQLKWPISVGNANGSYRRRRIVGEASCRTSSPCTARNGRHGLLQGEEI